MKKLFIFLLIFFLLNCKEKVKEEKFQEKKIEKKKEVLKNGGVKEEKDPLMKAMELLIAYKKNPEDLELKKKVCEAFRLLGERALKEGKEKIAMEYFKISSICGEEEKKIEEIDLPKEIDEIELKTKFSLSNFDVQFSGSKIYQVERALYLLDKIYMDISSELGIAPPKKIKVTLYTEKEFYDITGFPPWIGGMYDGIIHLPLANSNPEDPSFEKVIAHELTHAYLHNITKGKCPTWLHEGLAQYFDGTSLNNREEIINSLERNEIPPITSPSFIIMEKSQTFLLYQLSLATVLFLKERGSMGSISFFIKEIGEGKGIDEAFFNAFLFPYEEITERTKDFLKNQK